jgi:hypothetical protein
VFSDSEYEKRKEKGVCTHCGKNKPVKGGFRCQSCVDASKKMYNEIKAAKQSEHRHKVKAQAMLLLGGRCAGCGFDQLAALTIDHVNNDGAAKRRMGQKGGHPLYSWMVKNSTHLSGFQVLCANCNQKKAVQVARRSLSDNPVSVINRERKHSLKLEVMQHYGGPHCSCCGEDDIDMLCFDHINGGGNAHRRTEGIVPGFSLYSWLFMNDYPPGFQVLCFNCNQAKGTGAACPLQHA